jgi:hypothetical protein
MTKRIPPFQLVPHALDESASSLSGFKWAGEDAAGRKVGMRHKLGGDPDFLQKRHIPVCPECKQSMTFYGQLDSINDEYCIADCGIIYIFLCFDCFKTEAFVHSG